MISAQELSFLVQGPIVPETKKTIQSIKEFYPESSIILSAWDGMDTSSLLAIEKDITVVYTEDNFENYLMTKLEYAGKKFDKKGNNLHRQLATIKKGLNFVKTKYCVKLRTDFEVTSDALLQNISKYKKFNLNNDYKYLTERVLITGSDKNFPFFFFDFVYAGLTSDLRKIFCIDIPGREYFNYFENHIPKNISTYLGNPSFYQWIPEQYIVIASLLQNGVKIRKDIERLDWTYVDPELIGISNLVLASNFCILQFEKIGIMPRKDSLKWLLKKNESHAKFEDWMSVYTLL